VSTERNHASAPGKPTRFAIVGVQRTGTTWIRTTLNDHPAILALGEVFLYSHGRFPFRRRAGADVEHSYRKFLDDSLARKFRHHAGRAGLVREYLDHLYSRPGFEAIGFKLMRTQCDQFPMVVDFLLQEDVRIIHVVRRNVLKTLISRETARQRKLFHAKGSVPVAKITLDIASLRSALDRISDDNAYWTRIFGRSAYLQLSYEGFVTDKNTELHRIYEFLCVVPDHEVSSNLVKINPDDLSEVVSNFPEVRRALNATPYAWCLAD
jgi:hypothetical protein